MTKINKLYIFIIILASTLFSSSGEFTGWGNTILHHVQDSKKSIDILGIKISKHIFMLLFSGFITLIFSILATQKYRKNIHAKPSGLSQIFEIIMDFINKEIVIPNIGKNYTKIWTPVAMTFFIFILTCNFIGLIPFFDALGVFGPMLADKFHMAFGSGPFFQMLGDGGSTATGNFGVTLGFATITFFAIIIAGVKKHGFIGHWKNMVPSGVPAPVLIILIPIEIIGMFVKPFALIMRLGANMTAGHIGMVAIFALPIILGNGISGINDPAAFNYPIGIFAGFIAVLLNTAIYGLEIIVCLVQAYVFTLLSCVFIGMAIHADH
jgi:F-type H+-transporting ATPase subunit a